MCSNYRPVTRADRMLTFFGIERAVDEPPVDAWPTGLAPMIKLSERGQRIVESGHFGLLPHFAKEVAAGRRTYNARTETVAKLPSFRTAWAKGWRCIIPAEHIYEPNWETGKAVRWRISLPMDVPMGIAGIYTHWRDQEGRQAYTFAMLTVNADGHPVMQRFHKPGDEKRMVVILDPKHYDDWLTCSPEEAARHFKQWTGPMDAEAKPLPPRAKKGAEPPAPPPEEDEPDLF